MAERSTEHATFVIERTYDGRTVSSTHRIVGVQSVDQSSVKNARSSAPGLRRRLICEETTASGRPAAHVVRRGATRCHMA
jgi:hypothetical protein